MQKSLAFEKGGSIYVFTSTLIMKNCTIEKSFALYGSVFFINENRNSTVEVYNSIFLDNSASYNIIDLVLSKFVANNAIFQNNQNNLFSLDSSSCILINSTVLNNTCWAKIGGCVINVFDNSSFKMKLGIIENVFSYFEEGNIYNEQSSIEIFSSKMIGLSNMKLKGACISNYYSNSNITDSFFINYGVNCIYSMQSNLSIVNATFNNSNYQEKNAEKKNYGTLFCINCHIVMILNSNFIKNEEVTNGSAIYLKINKNVPHQIIIFKCIFQQNQAIDGTIFVLNQNISLIECLLELNIAKIGAGISLYNESNYFIYNDYLY